MFWFRFLGAVEIALSVSFPFIVSLPILNAQNNPDLNTLVITGISVSIALAAALRGFYGWDQNWQLYRNQQNVVHQILTTWELSMIIALQHPKEGRGGELARQATEDALADLARVLDYEHEAFFGAVQPPEDLRQAKVPPH
jgi:hypothetical protein